MIMLDVSELLLLKAVVIRHEINNRPFIIYYNNTFEIEDKYLSVIHQYIASSFMIRLSNIDARQASINDMMPFADVRNLASQYTFLNNYVFNELIMKVSLL